MKGRAQQGKKVSTQGPKELEISSETYCCKPGNRVVCPEIIFSLDLTPAKGNWEQPWHVPACCFSLHAASGTEAAATSCLWQTLVPQPRSVPSPALQKRRSGQGDCPSLPMTMALGQMSRGTVFGGHGYKTQHHCPWLLC